MALDRTLRVSFRLAEELGKDPEGQAEGRNALRKAYGLLTKGRAQKKDALGAGLELQSPDILVLAAEAAVQNGELEVAAKAVQDFFLQDPPKNQFYCRALFVSAQVEAGRTASLNGAALVRKVLRAIAFVMEAAEIAGQESNRPGYDFLLYNASVHYWRISRALLKDGSRRYAIESMSKIVGYLKSMEGGCDDVEWLMRYLVSLAMCLDEGNRHDEAIAQLKAAFELSEANGNVMEEEICRMYVWVCRHDSCSKALSDFVSSVGAKRGEDMQALVAVQRIAVGALDAAGAPDVLQYVLDKDPTAVGADILVMCGRIAENHDLENLARSFLDKVDKLEVGTATSTVRKEYLRAALTARETSQGVENDDGSRSKKGAVGAGLVDEFKMDSRRFAALKISRRIEGMRILERALVSAKRMKGQLATQLLHEGSSLAWNLGLPLLQDHLRRHVHRVFCVAAAALEDIDSPMKKLRAQLHFEIAKCEVASDFLAKAAAHVAKAKHLDFGDVRLPEGVEIESDEARNDMLRPLDRYLVPLETKLELKSSLYKEPERPEEKAVLLIEQAVDASDVHLKGNLLQRASLLLEQAEEEAAAAAAAAAATPAVASSSLDGTNAGVNDSQRKAAPEPSASDRDRVLLWGQVLREAWNLKLIKLSEKAIKCILEERLWDAERSKQVFVLQVSAFFMRAQCIVHKIGKVGVRLVDWQSVPKVYGLDVRALGLALPEDSKIEGLDGGIREELQSFKKEVIGSFLAGMRLAVKLNELALVENACIYLWNLHYHMFKGHTKERLGAVLPELKDGLVESLGALRDCKSNCVELTGQICDAVMHMHEQAGDLASAIECGEWCVSFASTTGGRAIHAALARMKAKQGGKGAGKEGLRPEAQVLALLEEISLKNEDDTSAKSDLFNQAFEIMATDGLRDSLVETTKAVERLPNQSKHSQAPKLNENDDAALETWAELWAKLTQVALDLGLLNRAQSAAATGVERRRWPAENPVVIFGVVDDGSYSKQIPAGAWRWYSVMESLSSQAILALVDEDKQSKDMQDELRCASLSHIAMAAKWGCRAKDPELVLDAARRAWNTSLPFTGSSVTRTLVKFPFRVVLSQLADVGEKTDFSLRVRIYEVLLQCCEDQQKWEEGLATVDEAFQHVPKAFQKSLWSKRVIFSSKMGKDAGAGIAKMKGETSSGSAADGGAKAYIILARNSLQQKDALAAYLRALEEFTAPSTGHVECMIELAEWLHSNCFKRASVLGYLQEALELIKDVEIPASERTSEASGPSNFEGGFGGDGARSVSRKSMRSQHTQRSGVSGGSRRSGSNKRSSTRRGHRSKESLRTSSGTGARSTSSSQRTAAGGGSASGAAMMTCKYFEQKFRIFFMLSKVSNTFSERTEQRMQSQRAVIAMWRRVLSTLNKVELIKLWAQLEEEKMTELLAASAAKIEMAAKGHGTKESIAELQGTTPEKCAFVEWAASQESKWGVPSSTIEWAEFVARLPNLLEDLETARDHIVKLNKDLRSVQKKAKRGSGGDKVRAVSQGNGDDGVDPVLSIWSSLQASCSIQDLLGEECFERPIVSFQYLQDLSTTLCEEGLQCIALPTLLLAKILVLRFRKEDLAVIEGGGPSKKVVDLEIAMVLATLNLRESAGKQLATIELRLTEAETKAYAQSVEEQKQSKRLSKAQTAEESNKDTESTLLRQEINGGAIDKSSDARRAWVRRAEISFLLGQNKAAKELLVEIDVHNNAFEDKACAADAALLRARIYMDEGFPNRALSAAQASMSASSGSNGTFARNVTAWHAAMKVFLKAYEQTHGANSTKKVLEAKVGEIKENESYFRLAEKDDLDFISASADLSARLAGLEVDEALQMRALGNEAWKQEYDGARRRMDAALSLMEGVEGTETRSYVELLMRKCAMLLKCVKTYESDMQMQFGIEKAPKAEIRSIFKDARECLSSAEICASKLNTRLREECSTYVLGGSEEISMATPSALLLAKTKEAMGLLEIQAVELGVDKGSFRKSKVSIEVAELLEDIMAGAEEEHVTERSVVDRWMEKTAPEEEASEAEARIQPIQSAIICLSTAQSLTPGLWMQGVHIAQAGIAMHHLAKAQSQTAGFWLPSVDMFAVADTVVQQALPRAATIAQLRMEVGSDILVQARATLSKGIKACQKLVVTRPIWKGREPDIVASTMVEASRSLAECYGNSNAFECTVQLIVSQSYKARCKMAEIFMNACAPANKEMLCLRQLERLKSTEIGTCELGLCDPLTEYLSESSEAWKRLDCTTDPKAIIASLPPSVTVVVLSCTANLGTLYASAVCGGCDGKDVYVDDDDAAADNADAAAGSTVDGTDDDGGEKEAAPRLKKILSACSRKEFASETGRKALRQLLKDFAVWKKKSEPFLIDYELDNGANGDFAGRDGGNDSLEKELGELVARMDTILSPLFSGVSGSGIETILSRPDQKDCVLLVDHELAPLPIEALSALQQAHARGTSISRDCSLHMLAHRMGAEKTFAQEVHDQSYGFISDPRDLETEGGVSAAIERAKGKEWVGITGKERVPSVKDWQSSLTGTEGFVFGGPCRLLAFCGASTVAGLNMTNAKAVIIIDRTTNGTCMRRQSKLDNQKSPEVQQLENSFDTAALLSLRGAKTVMLNQWYTSTSANCRLVDTLFTQMRDGVALEDAVRLGVRPEVLSPAAVADAGGNDEGAAQKKADESSEQKGDENSVPPRYKMRVVWNVTVYGLGRTSLV